MAEPEEQEHLEQKGDQQGVQVIQDRTFLFTNQVTDMFITNTGLPGLKPRFYLLLYDFFGPVSMTFYDQFMTF